MNTIDKRKKRTLEELKDKEYRDAYVSSGVDVGVAFQIRALREQRCWTQTQLAEQAGMKQPRIHELEDPNKSPTLSTLKVLAHAFDVGLMVRFVPFGDLVKWELNLSSESLEVPDFEQDPYFQENGEEIVIATDDEQYIMTPTQEATDKVAYLKDYIRQKDNFFSCSNILTVETNNESFSIIDNNNRRKVI